ncbi:hypothetical protein GCM10007860_15690 [Chitiniphilus shinanonensis]|uniref:DUF2946 domain-containing protein n=1 Tax=Chitiniphilus shinanonensis TaxID=553088 RepID=A0ABQ6BSK2_9NEIS|nr:DUF2946 domain-containing protein [Chitiniphilus shinanonensis]GLS04422.1 hypothetical protein GCM10007860_15690 [Chitiniphilus shinanonensis]
MSNRYGVFLRKSWWRKALGLALFAVLLNALAPSVSMTRAALLESPLDALVVCSVQTSEHPSQTSKPSLLDALSANYCQYCVTHAGSFGLAPVEQPPGLPSLAAIPATIQAHRHVASVDALLLPPPRGPPSLHA